MGKQTSAVRLSHLGELEFRNALHLAVFRGELTPSDAALKKRLFLADVEDGIFIIMPVPSATLIPRAAELADRHITQDANGFSYLSRFRIQNSQPSET